MLDYGTEKNLFIVHGIDKMKEIKICRICRQRLNIENFYKSKMNKWWYKTICKKCDLIKIKQWQWNLKISEKRKKENKETWWEKELFRKFLENIDFKCKLCNTLIKNPQARNIDHIKPKWKYPELRLDINNLQLLCFKCHYEKTHWWKYKWIFY